ncbi:Hypothetical protein PHPALM_19111 [Phytophthora palmivora]|uniref:TNFR-Cys domain-containing protein n=1 Tax=Phytophthora palmivora TaxID=4796 RepID=A0A2P4XI48_9STRA|nr:Hypothetical protein PHPALM_19111 [Phytophthora palmivora]
MYYRSIIRFRQGIDCNGASGVVTGKSVISTYVRQMNGTALAAVTLDRLVATQATLSPESTVTGANFGVSLRNQPLNLLIRSIFSLLGLLRSSVCFLRLSIRLKLTGWSSTALGLLPNPDVACKRPREFCYETQDGACVRCAAGSYCIAGMKRQCPDGTFSFGKAASCESCRDGWICTDGLARLCDPVTYSTPSFTCGICPSGYACQNGKKLVCPAGTFSLTKANRPPASSVRWGGLPTISATTVYRVRLVKQRFTLDNIPAHLVLLLPSQSTINLRFASHNVGRSNNLRPQDHAGIHDYAS